MTQPFRAATGGAIDRRRTLRFRFDGRDLEGHPGDTLSSALLANGIRLVGRSFKYHRPRGIFGYGAEDPNALFQLGAGAHAEPNAKGGQVPLVAGLRAAAQNCWPSRHFDLGAVAGLAAPLLPAGFYYKTFLWPRALWPVYERLIRGAAGLGRAPGLPDADRYEHRHAHVDTLVIGGGPAGLAAATAAARPGQRVMLVDDGALLGTAGDDPQAAIEGMPAAAWLAARRAALAALPDVMLLTDATAYGLYDGPVVGVLARAEAGSRQQRWMVRATRIVLASGALERPLVFLDNDRPGVMLATAARAFAERHAALPGRRAVVFTNNDSAYGTALLLHGLGVAIAAIVDLRPAADGPAALAARRAGLRCLAGHAVVAAIGGRRVIACDVMRLHGDGVAGDAERIACDTVLTAGGFTPMLQLFTQAGGQTVFDAARGAFLGVPASAPIRLAGAAAGATGLAEALATGFAAGGDPTRRPAVSEWSSAPMLPISIAPLPPRGRGKRFVDLHNDVTVEDLDLAVREGFSSIEQVKRYTTLGMGTDQGRSSGLIGALRVGERLGRTTGTSRFRPPFVPVTFGALAGRQVGPLAAPARVTPMHPWHEAAGARIAQTGSWRRPQLYPRPGESEQDSISREVLNARRAVGIVDVSTLGKFDLRGRDVAALLDRVYVNGWRTLAIGRCRYGVMLREDGMVLDDGTTSRLGERHYVMTVTSGNAERVQAHLDRLLQLAWPELDVTLTPVTEHFAAMAIVGPRARALLAALRPGFDPSDAALPHMGLAIGTLAGVAARVFRISFSGELAYEINVPARHGLAVWQAAIAAGTPLGLMPYGTEAMLTMRAEKGFFMPGFEADGRTSLDDLGLGRMMNRKKACIGQAALQRPAFAAPDRKQLVGLLAEDPAAAIPRGAQLVEDPQRPPPKPIAGHVTAGVYSPLLERWIALALVEGGRARLGEVLHAASPLAGEQVAVRIVDPVFLDPEGKRLHA